jgi:hypothetical protein
MVIDSGGYGIVRRVTGNLISHNPDSALRSFPRPCHPSSEKSIRWRFTVSRLQLVRNTHVRDASDGSNFLSLFQSFGRFLGAISLQDASRRQHTAARP